MNEPDRDLTDDDTAPLPPISDELSPAAQMPVQSHTTEFLLAFGEPSARRRNAFGSLGLSHAREPNAQQVTKSGSAAGASCSDWDDPASLKIAPSVGLSRR
jgi:hypothetical protein